MFVLRVSAAEWEQTLKVIQKGVELFDAIWEKVGRPRAAVCALLAAVGEVLVGCVCA